jgi:hypothetical protein
VDHRSSGTYDRILSDVQAWQYLSAKPDESTGTDPYPASQ